MPEPAGVLVAEGGRRVPIWTRGQLDILRAWHTARVMAELSARVPHGEATERFGWTRLPVENRAAEFRPVQAGF